MNSMMRTKLLILMAITATISLGALFGAIRVLQANADMQLAAMKSHERTVAWGSHE